MTYPQESPGLEPGQGVIEVTTSFFALAFLLYFCKPRVSINGHESIRPWGTASIPVPAGRYNVEAWTHYLFYSHMGRNGVVVDVAPGTVTRVKWKAPWLAFLQGSMKVTDVFTIGAGSAGATAPTAFPAAPAPAPAAPAPAAPAPAAAVPAAGAWHPDPSGRHEQRYHDGTSWTEHVSTQGVASTDPPEAS